MLSSIVRHLWHQLSTSSMSASLRAGRQTRQLSLVVICRWVLVRWSMVCSRLLLELSDVSSGPCMCGMVCDMLLLLAGSHMVQLTWHACWSLCCAYTSSTHSKVPVMMMHLLHSMKCVHVPQRCSLHRSWWDAVTVKHWA